MGGMQRLPDGEDLEGRSALQGWSWNAGSEEDAHWQGVQCVLSALHYQYETDARALQTTTTE